MSAALQPIEAGDHGMDEYLLTRELDKTKSKVFSGNSAAFLGPLLCSLNFTWTESIPTAATDGVNLLWNPRWFLSLTPGARATVLLHELWHVGRLHFIRRGSRDPLVWNWAADIRINNDLETEGRSFEGIEWCWKDQSYPPEMPEEDIYDALIQQGKQPQGNSWTPMPGSGPEVDMPGTAQPGDMLPTEGLSKEDQIKAVNNVVRAIHQAKLNGAPGDIPGGIETILTTFLAPVVPWEQLLHQFMRDLIEEGLSWARPNRRFTDIYLPSRHTEEGRLEHIMYFEDVSGSISDADNTRFNSEIHYVKRVFNPPKLSLVQFDTQITQVKVFDEDDPFEEIKIVGRGGTCLRCVREHIIEERPSAVIIFSDLECEPMEPLPFHVPILWVCIRNREASVPFGKLIRIR